MGSKRPTKSLENTPGPGAYTTKLNKGPAFTMQRRYEGDHAINENMNKPGPNAYSPNINLVKSSVRGYTMGKKHQAQTRDVVPGPGEYKYYAPEAKGKGWTMVGRPKTADRIKSPGPGAYNVKPVKRDRQGYTMGSKRTTKSLESVPGPGAYTTKLENGPAFTMQRRYEGDHAIN